MIKEVIEDRLDSNIDDFLDEIVSYLGENYKEKIYKEIRNTHIAVIRDVGVVDFGDEKVYIEEEPICVKKDKNYIFVPVTLMKDPYGNVVFLHLLLHAVFSDGIKNKNDLLSEILIDYIADEISKGIENKKVNITFNEKPIYESNTFYSRFFDLIREFYKKNKSDIIQGLLDDNYSVDDEEIIELLEENFNDILLEEEKKTENKVKKK